MSKLVRIKGTDRIVRFPDSMTDEQIEAALDEELGGKGETSALGTAAGRAISSVPGSLGAWGGFKAGAALGAPIAPPWGAAIGGVGGAIVGGVLGAKAGESFEEHAAPKFKEYVERGSAEHPKAALAGDVAGMASIFKFAPGAAIRGFRALPAYLARKAAPEEAQAAKIALLQTGLGTATGVVSPLLEGRAPTAGGIAESAILANLFGAPRFGKGEAPPAPVTIKAEGDRYQSTAPPPPGATDITQTVLPDGRRLWTYRLPGQKGKRARSKQKATEIHGNVRPLETPAEGVPEPGSGAGIQPQAQGGLPQTEQTPGAAPGQPRLLLSQFELIEVDGRKLYRTREAITLPNGRKINAGTFMDPGFVHEITGTAPSAAAPATPPPQKPAPAAPAKTTALALPKDLTPERANELMEEGMSAFWVDKAGPDDNPYQKGTSAHEMWNHGWRVAKADKVARVKAGSRGREARAEGGFYESDLKKPSRWSTMWSDKELLDYNLGWIKVESKNRPHLLSGLLADRAEALFELARRIVTGKSVYNLPAILKAAEASLAEAKRLADPKQRDELGINEAEFQKAVYERELRLAKKAGTFPAAPVLAAAPEAPAAAPTAAPAPAEPAAPPPAAPTEPAPARRKPLDPQRESEAFTLELELAQWRNIAKHTRAGQQYLDVSGKPLSWSDIQEKIRETEKKLERVLGAPPAAPPPPSAPPAAAPKHVIAGLSQWTEQALDTRIKWLLARVKKGPGDSPTIQKYRAQLEQIQAELERRQNEKDVEARAAEPATPPGKPQERIARVQTMLQQEHGITPGQRVKVLDRPGSIWLGRTGFDPVTRKPTYVYINSAKVRSARDLAWVMEHESAHWWDLANPGEAKRLLATLTPDERASIEREIKDLEYELEKGGLEASARGIQQLAESWRSRPFFEQLVSRVLAFATDAFGFKPSRLAAERMAVLALVQAGRAIKGPAPWLDWRGNVVEAKGAPKSIRELQAEVDAAAKALSAAKTQPQINAAEERLQNAHEALNRAKNNLAEPFYPEDEAKVKGIKELYYKRQMQREFERGRAGQEEGFAEGRKGKADAERYAEVQARMRELMRAAQHDTPEFSALFAEMEQIKNRHRGMPPAEAGGKPPPIEPGEAEQKPAPPSAPTGEIKAGEAPVSPGAQEPAISDTTPEAPGSQEPPIDEGFVEARGYAKVKRKVEEQRRGLLDTIKRWPIREYMAQLFDSTDNAARILGAQAHKRLTQLGNQIERLATYAFVESKQNPATIAHYIAQAQAGGNEMAARAAQYALDHLNDPRMEQLAKEARGYMDDIIRREHRTGSINTPYLLNYLPHLYDRDLLMGFNQPFVLGGGGGQTMATGFKKPRTYENIYDAISEGHPVTEDTLDVANAVEHRIRVGERLINRFYWGKMFKHVKDEIDGFPIFIQPKTVVRPGAMPAAEVVPPSHQIVEIIPGVRLGVHKGYASLFDALTANSRISGSAAGRLALETKGAIKGGLLAFDIYHVMRMLQRGLFLMGPSKMGWRKGLTILEYPDKALNEAVAQGEITAEMASEARANRAELQAGIKMGLNVGRVQENLYRSTIRNLDKLPKWTVVHYLGTLNKWIFDKLTRGLMAQSYLHEIKRLQAELPDVPIDQLRLRVARDINVYYGNLGRQGIFKSAQAQDVAMLVALAPFWVESLVRMEAKSLINSVADPIRYQKLAVTTLPMGVGSALLSYFAVTQLANLWSRGKYTWENEEPGHKLDAFIPDLTGKSRGFFFSPFSVPAEITHDLIRYLNTEPDVLSAVARILANKASPPLRAVKTLLTGERWDREKIVGPWEKVKAAALDLVPIPIGAQAPLLGSRYPGQFQRQLMATAGFKAEPAPSAAESVALLKKRWMADNPDPKLRHEYEQWQKSQFAKSDYAPLRRALAQGNLEQARKEFETLRTEGGKKVPQIREAIKPFTGGTVSRGQWLDRRYKAIGGQMSLKTERRFAASLKPEEQRLYQQARQEAQAVWDNYKRMILLPAP